MSYSIDTIELRKKMVENGIFTITQLAKKAGISRNTAAGVVNGTIRPSASVMEKIASALNMSSAEAGNVFFVPNLLNA